jgi:rhamnose utilization protein RhaD (predicted bifunctional aldolase and dehydrogenase)
MPGFILAKEIHKMVKNVDWKSLDGIILHNHGIFTFSNDAKESYDNMVKSVSMAEDYLSGKSYNIEKLQNILEDKKGHSVYLRVNSSYIAKYFASQDENLFKKGVLTPEHIIRTKRFPALIIDNYEDEINSYIEEYKEYFNRYATSEIMLNPAPNWLVLKGYGVVAIGKNEKEAMVIEDIIMHTIDAILRGEALGGYKSINENDSFDMEYWELEQNKLKAK